MRVLAYQDRTLEACPSRKIVYTTREMAAAAEKRGGSWGKGLKPYKCPHCSSWHLGHRKKR